jgi:glycopeptide antibiotics resistance protein
LALLFILFLARGSSGGLYQWKFFSKEHLDMVNLLPFGTLKEFMQRLEAETINRNIVIRNILINLWMFAPMGAMLPLLFAKRFDRFWKTILFVGILVLIIEILQFCTFCGSADIDDLLFNTFGAAVGYLIYYIILKIKKSGSRL